MTDFLRATGVGVRRGESALAVPIIVVTACIVGWAATGPYIPFINSSAVVVIGTAGALAALFVLGSRIPMLPFAALLVMFPLGDFIRKAGTGDPRLIFVRDVLLVVGLLVLTARAAPWRDVRAACRPWLVPLAAFGVWFVVAAVNSAAFASVQVPLVGARLYFEYLPLIGLGWYAAQDPARLRRTATCLAVVLCATTIVGIAHAIGGPDFLPGADANAKLFTHLDLQRLTNGQTAGQVFQPTGLFVEPGRFADWAFVNFAFGLALVPHARLRFWRFVVPLIGAIGLFAASNRTTIVAAIFLAVIVSLRQTRLDSVRAIRVGISLVLLFCTVATLTRTFFPAQFESRVQFVGRSLNVTSSQAEGSTRIPSYAHELFIDIGKGGLVGRGAGTQGLGRQYLGAAATQTITEGGFATVMVESGVIGFLLWITWTGAAWRFARRTAKAVSGTVGQTVSTLATALAIQLFVIMFIGINAVQDFVFNSWLFAVLGFIAAVGAGLVPLDGGEAALGEREEEVPALA